MLPFYHRNRLLIKQEDQMFLSQIRKRRSIRKYSTEAVEAEKITHIVEAILRSPSSRGYNPWEFVLVTDRVLLEKLSRSKPHGSSFLKNAALAIVICADSAVTDTWIEDTAIATVVGQFAAESLGLGTCWVQIRNREHNSSLSAEQYVASLTKIPENLRIESIIGIGYPDELKPDKKTATLQFEKVKLNDYQTKFLHSQPD